MELNGGAIVLSFPLFFDGTRGAPFSLAADVPPPFSLRSDNIVATLPVRILIGGSGNRKVALSERNYVTRAHDHNFARQPNEM